MRIIGGLVYILAVVVMFVPMTAFFAAGVIWECLRASFLAGQRQFVKQMIQKDLDEARKKNGVTDRVVKQTGGRE